MAFHPPNQGLTPAQEVKLDLVHNKIDIIISCFGDLYYVLGQLEVMKKNDSELDGVYLSVNKICKAIKPAIEGIVKPAYEVLAEKLEK